MRAAVAALRGALPAAAPADGAHAVVLQGRQVGNVVITRSEDGWAVTEYEIEVPSHVCEQLVELRQDGT